MKVSAQVRTLIENCPLSRHRLCILAGVNPANLSQFLSGNRGMSQETLDAIGLVLGFKVTMDKAAARRLAAEAPAPGRPPAKPDARKRSRGKMTDERNR